MLVGLSTVSVAGTVMSVRRAVCPIQRIRKLA